MIGGSRIPIKDWPTRKLIGVGSVLVLITGAITFLALRAAWTAWKQGATGLALGAFAAAILFGSWVVVIWEMGSTLLHRWRSRRDHRRATSRVELNTAGAKNQAEIKQS